MNASELIQELESLVERHGGDLVVSIILSDHEFSVATVGFEKEGSIARIKRNRANQHPPDRIVIEVEDKLDDAD